jgi:alkanesulfonate monooxygenase SsuD/methylene tetrahydromethanopterin reductase-like flavin-dependent oxidoreductase (luciferase family)
MTELVMRFDMRNPDAGAPKQDLYQAAIEMAAWADRSGFDVIQISEHHGSADGYLPSPVVLASAIAARTENIRIRLSLITLPFNHPLRIAEDIAVLDIISNGRVEAVFGGGYAPHEFAMFGVDPRRRARIVEEGIEAIKNAWSGEEFQFEGRAVRVRPTPLQRPRPPLWMGGSSPAAARRAARIADYFYTAERPLYEEYRRCALAAGRDPGPWRDIGSGFFILAADPQAEARRMAPYILHECNSYSQWQDTGNADAQYQYSEVTEVAPLLSSGLYPILALDDAPAYVEKLGADGALCLHPLISGLPPAIGWEHIHYFEKHLLPRLR